MPVYVVRIDGFDSVREQADTFAKARYSAFKKCREAGYRIEFMDFMQRVTGWRDPNAKSDPEGQPT